MNIIQYLDLFPCFFMGPVMWVWSSRGATGAQRRFDL